MNRAEKGFRADLHTHTYFSDGADSPEALLLAAKGVELSGLSITDHDSVEAYSVALPIASKLKIPLLSGIEFSAHHRKEPVHVLGYGFDLNSDVILHFCNMHRERRKERNLKILEKLEKLGILITYQELEQVLKEAAALKKRTLGRPHIALCLVKKGIVRSVQEAFQKYLAEGKPAYDPGEKVTPEQTIHVIHQAGGKAVIAHPHLLKHKNVIKDLLEMSFDGIEGYYAKMPKDVEAKWVALGKERGWIITGGSDYHGAIKPQNPLGTSWVDRQTFDLLYECFLANN